MAVGQISVPFTPLPNHFHALKDHGKRKVYGFVDALFFLAPMCLAPKAVYSVQRKEKHETMLHSSEGFTTSVMGQ